MKGSRSKLKAILTVLCVVTEGILHVGNKMDRLQVRECSFNATIFSKICKRSYTPHHMLAPALARHVYLVTREAILF